MTTITDSRLAALVSQFKALTCFDESHQADLVQTIEQGNIIVNSEGAMLAWCAYTRNAGFAPDDCLKLGEPCVFPDGRDLLAKTGLVEGPWASDIAYVVIAPEDLTQVSASFHASRRSAQGDVGSWHVRAKRATMLAYLDEHRVMHHADKLGEFGPILRQWHSTQAL